MSEAAITNILKRYRHVNETYWLFVIKTGSSRISDGPIGFKNFFPSNREKNLFFCEIPIK